MPAPLRIGVAPCFFHADPTRPIFKGKTLLYLEQSMAHWLMNGGALPLMLPTPGPVVGVDELLDAVDGLVLQGGSDVAPASYGEEPQRPEWQGDRVRDRIEGLLVRAAMARHLPVLGICRGLQLINVVMGGTLHQDVVGHRNWEEYDHLQHDIRIEPQSLLAKAYGGIAGARVNSVHHQAIKQLGVGLVAEAMSPDGIVEAIRFAPSGDDDDAPFVYAVQWHPEFQDPADRDLLSAVPLRDLFLSECVRQGRRATEPRRHGTVAPSEITPTLS